MIAIEFFFRGLIVGALGVLPWISLLAGWGIAATAALTVPAIVAGWFLAPNAKVLMAIEEEPRP